MSCRKTLRQSDLDFVIEHVYTHLTSFQYNKSLLATAPGIHLSSC